MTEAETPPPIHVAMSRVLSELPAIGKDSWNEQQRFHFRGVDAVLNALNPLLAKHGVTIIPAQVIERLADKRATKSGGVMFEVNLHVRFRLIGPAGDYIEGEAWGEGTDSGDKATGKAHTAAQKAFLIQAFSVSTQEQTEDEPDRHTPEPTVPVALAPENIITDLKRRIARLPDDKKEALREDWKSLSSPLSRLHDADLEDAVALVELHERAAKETPPAAPPATPAAAPASVDPGRPFEEATSG